MTPTESNGTLENVLTAVFALGAATKADLLTGAVAARAGSSVYEKLLRLPDGIYLRVDDVHALLLPGGVELAS